MSAAREPIVVKVDEDIADLVPKFLVNRKNDVETLRAAQSRGDKEAVRKLGHTLKGVGGGYGFPVISEIGARIEEAALAGDSATIERSIAELGEYLARVRVEVA